MIFLYLSKMMQCKGVDKVKKKKKIIDQRCKELCHFYYCKKHWKENSKKINGGLTLIVLLLTIPTLIFFYKDRSKSDKQHFKDREYIPGILAPFGFKDTIKVYTGTGSFTAPITEQGITFEEEPGMMCEYNKIMYNPMSLRIKALNGFFSISLKITDYKTHHLIGQIENNQWVLRSDGIYDWESNDSTLEIEDCYGNVAFRLSVLNHNSVKIIGYFFSSYCGFVLFDNDPISYFGSLETEADKQTMEYEISKNKIKYCKIFKN